MELFNQASVCEPGEPIIEYRFTTDSRKCRDAENMNKDELPAREFVLVQKSQMR
jgi:hypothetical protein